MDKRLREMRAVAQAWEFIGRSLGISGKASSERGHLLGIPEPAAQKTIARTTS
jgi:hypothetical protein